IEQKGIGRLATGRLCHPRDVVVFVDLRFVWSGIEPEVVLAAEPLTYRRGTKLPVAFAPLPSVSLSNRGLWRSAARCLTDRGMGGGARALSAHPPIGAARRNATHARDARRASPTKRQPMDVGERQRGAHARARGPRAGGLDVWIVEELDEELVGAHIA